MKTCGNSLDGRRVLVIEDEPLVAMLLEDALSEIGCEVAGVGSRFQDALEKALCAALTGKSSLSVAGAQPRFILTGNPLRAGLAGTMRVVGLLMR